MPPPPLLLQGPLRPPPRPAQPLPPRVRAALAAVDGMAWALRAALSAPAAAPAPGRPAAAAAAPQCLPTSPQWGLSGCWEYGKGRWVARSVTFHGQGRERRPMRKEASGKKVVPTSTKKQCKLTQDASRLLMFRLSLLSLAPWTLLHACCRLRPQLRRRSLRRLPPLPHARHRRRHRCRQVAACRRKARCSRGFLSVDAAYPAIAVMCGVGSVLLWRWRWLRALPGDAGDGGCGPAVLGDELILGPAAPASTFRTTSKSVSAHARAREVCSACHGHPQPSCTPAIRVHAAAPAPPPPSQNPQHTHTPIHTGMHPTCILSRSSSESK